MIAPAVALTALLTGLAVALLVAALVPPRRRIAGRVRPYAVGARTSLGRGAGVRVADLTGGPSGGVLRRLFGPLLAAVVRRLGRWLDAGGEDRLRLALRQSRLLPDVPEERRLEEYRIRQVGQALLWSAAAVAVGLAVDLPLPAVLIVGALGIAIGGARWRARLDRAIEDRRERMRVELYTVNQLIALNVRVGGGVVQAVQRVVARGRGELVGELSEVLRSHASGTGLRQAFLRAAATTPEPHVARTWRLLAAASEYGTDLAEALLAHSEDVREARRDALRRSATRRRAGMLVPIIGILAPVMLLFIAAPLPSLVFDVR